MKLKLITISLAMFVLLSGVLFLVHRVMVSVPGHPGKYSFGAKQTQPEVFTTIEGKIEKVRNSDSISDFSSSLVLISNEGELIILTGFGPAGRTKLESRCGEPIKIQGHWFGKLRFRSKTYRALWLDEIIEDKKNPV